MSSLSFSPVSLLLVTNQRKEPQAPRNNNLDMIVDSIVIVILSEKWVKRILYY